VGTSNEYPASADQIYSALVALGTEPVLDPDLWPSGPMPEDRVRLLGALLAAVELEITASSTGSGDEQLEDFAEAVLGWMEKVGADPRLSSVVLSNRLQRTAVQLMGTEEDEGELPGGRAASMAAAMAAAELLTAHMQVEWGDADSVRQALNRAEGAVADVLGGMHALRAAIGDVEE
jgi:hypothetical protein